MDLRKRSQLKSNLNDKEWIVDNKRELPGDAKCSTSKKKKSSKENNQSEHKIDSFCWICHLSVKQGNICSLCPRVYHLKCAKNRKISGIENGCPECLSSMNGQDGCFSSSKKKLNAALIFSLNQVFVNRRKLCELYLNWPDHEENKLIKIVDQEYFLKKLKANFYEKPVEFLSDFKWFYHNCAILFEGDSKIKAAAEQLIKHLQEELNSLEACIDCYIDRHSTAEKNTSNSQTCTKPHEIIWAKVRGFTYWPAKVLRISEKRSADVVFFGTKEISCVPSHMWFSLKDKAKLSQAQQKYSLAIEEFLDHVDKCHMNTEVRPYQSTSILSTNRSRAKGTQTIPDECNEVTEKETSSKETQTSEEFGLGVSPGFTRPKIVSVSTVNEPFPECESFEDIPEISIDNDSITIMNEPTSIEMVFSAEKNFNNSINESNTEVPFFQNQIPQVNQDNKNTEERGSFFVDDPKKDDQPSVDATSFAKMFPENDPEFQELVQKKSKDLYDSLMKHIYNKYQQAQKTDKDNDMIMKELETLKEQKLQLKNKLNKEGDFWKTFQADINLKIAQIVCEKNEKLEEMATRLKNIKKEKEEILSNLTN